MADRPKKTTVQRFLDLVQADKKVIFYIYLIAILAGLINLSLPLGIQAIINLIQGGQVSTSWVVLVAVVLVGMFFVGMLQVAQLKVIENWQQHLFTRISFDFAYRIPRLAWKERSMANLNSKVNHFFDTVTLQKGAAKVLIDSSIASLQIIFGLILLSLYHPFFIAFGLLLLILLYVIFRFTGPQGLSTSIEESTYKYQMAYWLQRLMKILPVLKIYPQASSPLNQTNYILEGYLEARQGHFKILIRQFYLMVMFKILVTAGLLLAGSLLVFENQLNLGQFVAAEIVILLVMNSVEKLIRSIEDVYDVFTSIEKLGVVNDMEIETGLDYDFKEKKNRGLSIEARKLKVPFHNTKEAEISFDLDPQENLLIKADPGFSAEKLFHRLSTIDAEHCGNVLYNELSISDWNELELRDQIGIWQPEDDLLQGTVAENITMGNTHIELDEIKAITKDINLHDYIVELPKGYSSPIWKNTEPVDKYLHYKMSLARAIAKKPRLLLIDDSVFIYEEEENKRLLEYLTDKHKPWSLLMFTHQSKWEDFFDKKVELKIENQ